MFDDKLMADSKVSVAGDINIPPTQAERKIFSETKKKLQNVRRKYSDDDSSGF